jgi:hypothetical protein
MAINDTILPNSPVPSDAYYLDDYSMPFTAFGQYGEGNLDVRVFDQDIYWVNIEGEPFYISEMSPEYISNVITFLLESLEAYYLGYMTYAFSFASLTPYKDSLRSMFQEDNITETKSKTEWLVSTILVKKLMELHAQHSLA